MALSLERLFRSNTEYNGATHFFSELFRLTVLEFLPIIRMIMTYISLRKCPPLGQKRGKRVKRPI
jgi:hypothetical protein